MKKFTHMLTESFLSGIFGTDARVPWDGPEQSEDKPSKYQISIDTQGVDTFIVGGGMLTSVSPITDAAAKQSATRISTYRAMQYYPEVMEATEHVVNDAISSDSDQSPITINLDRLEIADSVKDSIREKHDKIMRLMDMDDNGYEVVRQFFIDGKRAYQIILDDDKKKNGIKKLVVLESSAIRPAKLVEIERSGQGIEYVKSEKNTFIYNSTSTSQQGVTNWVVSTNQNRIIEMHPESVAYADSGLYSADGKYGVGFLEPAVKPANNLKTVEDATVIYAITRAIDKRAFYLDVGDLPKKSAEEYMSKMMSKFKTKLNYNTTTGEVDQNKVNISMVEDLWMPRREGQNATEIQNLEAGKNLGEINHVQYMKEKLYTSLLIPKNRMSNDSLVNIGGSELAQVTREEWRFSKFIARFRRRFSSILKQALKVELIQTGVLTEEDWNEFQHQISFDFTSDSYIKEQQENEILRGRIDALRDYEPYVGKLFSISTIQRKVLKMSDEEIEKENELIEEERKAGKYEDYGETPLKMKAQELSPPEETGFSDGGGTKETPEEIPIENSEE